MGLQAILRLFNRALKHSFEWKKCLFLGGVLALSSLLILVCHGLGHFVGKWAIVGLTFLPFFLCAALLFASEVVLIRFYHHEIKGLSHSFQKVISDSWERMMTASYFAFSFFFTELMLWILMGVFLLLSELPLIGVFFQIVFSIGPFLLLAATLILAVLTLFLAFYIIPALALKKTFEFKEISINWFQQLKNDPFSALLLLGVGVFPLIFLGGFAWITAYLTKEIYSEGLSVLGNILQNLFIMIPMVMILVPAILFFFNFAAESYVFMNSLLPKDTKAPSE